MLAVIKTGGKQYLVKPGDKIKIEKIDKKEGEELVFDQVLLLEKNKKLEIGQPFIKGAKLTAKVLRQAKGPKAIVFKYKPKTRYRKKTGHRQLFTEVIISSLQGQK